MTDEPAVDDSTVSEPDGEPSEAPADAYHGPGWDRSATMTADGRLRVRRRRRKGARRIFIGLGVFVLLLVAAVLWLVYTGFRARTELEAVRAGVHALRAHIAAGDLHAARADARDLQKHADEAYSLTTGPLWASAAAIPYLGDPLDTTRAVTSSVHEVADGALPRLIDASHRLTPGNLRRPDGSFDLATISGAQPLLAQALSVMDHAVQVITSASDTTWSGQVNSARDDLLAQLTQLTGSVHTANLAADVLPPMLGADGPRYYMVAFENEAELRGLGGLPGAFAILRADHGKLSFVRFESDSALGGVSADVDFGHEYDSLWPGGPTGLYVNSTESPHFPFAARIWASMWQRKSGQRLDGALALDPTTLRDLLEVTGPATLPDHTVVSANNVVAMTQQRIYQRFATDNAARKTYLLQIARAVATKLIAGNADPTSLVKAAGKAAGQYRLLVWARDRSIETQLSSLPVSGVVPQAAGPYAGVAIVNTLGSKLDYYLHASLDWRSAGCGQFRAVTATITLRNDAPSHGLARYVLGYTGKPGFPAKPGTTRLSLYYYGSVGAVLDATTIDGKRVGTYDGYEQGHPVYGIGVTIAPGAQKTVVLHLNEPAGDSAPRIRAQPMVNAMQTHSSTSSCGP